MKKKLTISITLMIIAFVVILVIVLNRPYKPTSFVVDGAVDKSDKSEDV